MRRIALFCLAAAAGCGGGTASSAGGSAPAPARNANVISEAEIAQVEGVTNAFDLVRRLRPNFLRTDERTSLRSNASTPLVRLDGQLLGEVSELRGVEIGVIREIRYYSIVEAETRYSGVRGRPLIDVTTKRLRRP
jgi:hypothetical protein